MTKSKLSAEVEESKAEPGTLEVLNIGKGDMKFSFDSNDPQEVARASRVVKDMLQRGYMLFATDPETGTLKRALEFDEKTNCYIVADGPEAQPVPLTEEAKPKAGNGRRGRRKQIPAKGTRATGVAPSAGG